MVTSNSNGSGDGAQVATQPAPAAPPVSAPNIVETLTQLRPSTPDVAPAPQTAAQPAPSTPPAPQGPYELPADFQRPSPGEMPQGGITDPERLQLDYYRRREQEFSARDQERNLDNYQQQAYQYYMNPANGYNYDEQTAQAIAQVHRQERAGALQRELAIRAEFQAAQRGQQEAQEVAKQYNINPSALAGVTGRENMVKFAGLVRYMGEERRKTEARLAALEKGRVPEQQFASGAGQGGVGNEDYATRLKSGKALPSAAEIDRMTARFANLG